MFSMSKFKRSPNVSERRFNVQLFFARITLQTVKVEPDPISIAEDDVQSFLFTA